MILRLFFQSLPSKLSKSRLNNRFFMIKNRYGVLKKSPVDEKELFRLKQKVTDGYALMQDYQTITDKAAHLTCECESSALRRVVWTYRVGDIIQMARRFRDPIILSLEYRQKGSRLFFATSRRHIFHYFTYLRQQKPEHSTWHEILSDLTPLRLFFDFEFYYETNPDSDALVLLKEFRRLISQILIDNFQLKNDGNLRFIELDSTTDEKFSRHLILHMKNDDGKEITFKNSKEMREFIFDSILPALNNRDDFHLRPKPGFYDDNDGSIIDLKVYKEKAGQNFRILGSPKFGRDIILRFASNDKQRHEFRFHDPFCLDCERMFLDSLITASNNLSIINPKNQLLISKKDLENFRGEINRSDMDTKKFGVKCSFYYEIQHFLRYSKLCSSEKFDKDLLADLITAIKRSQIYDHLPEDDQLIEYVELFKKFKRLSVSRDDLDLDLIYECAGDLLDIFERRGILNEIDAATDRMDSKKSESPDMELDKFTKRQLCLMYETLEKWKQKSASNFFVNDYQKSKGLYDSFMNLLIQFKKSIIPKEFPTTLTRENFEYVYNLLSNLKNEENQQKRMEREKLEKNSIKKLDKIRLRLEEEKRFCQWLEGQNEGNEKVRIGVRMAMDHSRQLIKDFESRLANHDGQ